MASWNMLLTSMPIKTPAFSVGNIWSNRTDAMYAASWILACRERLGLESGLGLGQEKDYIISKVGITVRVRVRVRVRAREGLRIEFRLG
jgi:hypothetical protein